MTAEATYTSDTIVALEGLEPVRKRPGMYIGSTQKAGFHHLLWEVVDNSVDEAMGGHCDRIDVVLNKDGSATVVDNGRGIPVEPQKQGSYKGMPTVEMVLTVLHAGGKFEGNYGGFSGGLHGVGISVVNALSEFTHVEVRRDGQRHTMKFGTREDVIDGKHKLVPGVVTEELRSFGRIPQSETGTSVTFLPDERVFEAYWGWDVDLIARRLRNAAFLNPQLTFTLKDDRGDGDGVETVYHYPGGLKDFINLQAEDRLAATDNSGKTEMLMPLEPITLGGVDADADGEWQMVMRWYPDQAYNVLSFANGIETTNHGTHVNGYQQVLTTLMNRYARQDHIALLGDKDYNLEASDVRSGLGVIISVKVREPQFVGQTKGELSNDETRVMVRQGFNEQFWNWMQEHPTETKTILSKVIDEMRMRHKLAAMAESERAKQEKRGFVARSQPLPTKLNDAETKQRDEAELFIVEGDSAAGPANMSRDPRTQAVLPIRGKGLNVERADAERIEGNKEVQSLIATIGAGSQDHFDLGAARYGKVVILTDADDDGRHIQMLLMTTFYRLMTGLVRDGRLYVARSPLYSATISDSKVFAYSIEERQEIEAANPRKQITWTRFKGLGEMNADELGVTTIDPSTRHLVRVTVEDAAEVDRVIENLMGGDSGAKWDELQHVVVNDEDALV